MISGVFVRMTRANMMETMRADYRYGCSCKRIEGEDGCLLLRLEKCVAPDRDNHGFAICPPTERRHPD